MVKKRKSKEREDKEKLKRMKEKEKVFAVIGLIINLVFPGIGSIIGGRVNEGIWQVVLFIIGFPLMIIMIGFAVIFAAWIWALVTSIQMVNEAYK